MGLLSGLEKFGLSGEGIGNLFAEEEKEPLKKEEEKPKKEEVVVTESDFLLVKRVKCPVCDQTFPSKVVKSGKARRLQPDDDLRPRHETIDTIKYDVVSCPYCGYTSMIRYFNQVSPAQRKLLRENVMANFRPDSAYIPEMDTTPYTYDEAIDMYKLAVFNTVVRRGKTSEKAYECLKIAWLYRGKIEELERQMPGSQTIVSLQKEMMEFYEQAFEGFQKAISSELYPICGMDQQTLDLLLATMGYKLGKYEVSSRYIQAVLLSKNATKATKQRAEDLKEKLIVKLRESH